MSTALFALLPLLAAPAATPAQPLDLGPLSPLAHWAGRCFQGAMPEGAGVDTHCFTLVYGGAFIRDVHTITGGPSPDGGETLFAWNAKTKQIEFTYYAMDGSLSRGAAKATPKGLSFPDEAFTFPNGETMTLNSQWLILKDGGFKQIAERVTEAGNVPMWEITYGEVKGTGTSKRAAVPSGKK